VVYQLFTLLVSTARVLLLIPPHVFICIFLFDRLVRGGLFYFTWLVSGWSRTRETWVDGFFPGAGLAKKRGWGFFFTIARAARSLCSQ